MTTRQPIQIGLKSLLISVFCLCAGLVTATNYNGLFRRDSISIGSCLAYTANICFASIAVGIVIGLVQQIFLLRRASRSLTSLQSQQKTALRFAVIWRAKVAILLALCLVVQMGLTQGLILDRRFWDGDDKWDLRAGYYDAVIPDAMVLICTFLALRSALSSFRRRTQGAPHSLKQKIWIAACVLIAVAALADEQLITYLVYKALAGVANVHAPQFRRPGAYVDQQVAGYWFTWLALAAFISLLVGAALWLRVLRRESQNKILKILIGLVFVSLSAGYGYWFFTTGFPTLAPDFAEAGLQNQWWHWAEAVILLILALPFAAYRIAQSPTDSFSLDFSEGRESKFIHLSIPMLSVGALGSIAFLISYLLANSEFILPSITWNAWSFLANLNVYLPIAVSFVCLNLFWKSIRSHSRDQVVTIPLIDPGRFTLACVALWALVIAGIPTVTAFGFALWLTPLPTWLW